MHAAPVTRTHRLLVVLLLFLQLAALGVVPVIHVAAEVVSLRRVTHVESKGHDDGDAPHNDRTCQLCGLAGPNLTSARVLAELPGAPVARMPGPSTDGSLLPALSASPTSARAPPPRLTTRG